MMKLHNYTQVDIFKKAYQKEQGNEEEMSILDRSNGVAGMAKGPT